ncbi:MAG: cytochrome c3 family protein [Planctomycetota bacterium]
MWQSWAAAPLLTVLISCIIRPAGDGNDSGVVAPPAGSPTAAGAVIPPQPTLALGVCVGCHASTYTGYPAAADPERTRAHWTVAAGLTNDDCQACHDTSLHESGTIRLWGDVAGRTSPFDASYERGRLTGFCLQCHTDTHPGIHATGGAWNPACTDCHDVHDPANRNRAKVADLVWSQAAGRALPVVFTSRTGPESFSTGAPGGTGICQVCHATTRYHRADGGGQPHHPGADCTACHTHAAGFAAAGASSCIACHAQAQGPRPAIVRADGGGGHVLAGGRLTDPDCVVCHDTSAHRQGQVRLWTQPGSAAAAFGLTGQAAQLNPFCTTCHGSAAIHTTGTGWTPACTECHHVHSPDNQNRALVAPQIRNRTLGDGMPVVFTARTGAGSFSPGGGARTGVCQVCHTATLHHRYNGAGIPHREGSDCATCHAHTRGFIPAGGTSCIGCHATPQGGRRAVLDEFGLASHHVGANPTDADCLVCHDISQHQQGTVRLRNVDDPNNPAAVVAVSGNPLTNLATAKTLEPFCLACHDNDAAGGAAPFSTGTMPKPIDAANWAAAAHQAVQTTCLGDGETFGCHATGHGSLKRKLLAPWQGGQAPVAGDPLREEEGQCYTCHDADGPAGTNVQAHFELLSHHKVSSLEQADGSRIECTHCHDPHAARSDRLLRNPDTGAAWTGSGEAFCLTCHDGAPPAGVAFPPTAPGTGWDKSAFAGTTHSTALGERSCRHCHTPHGAANAALLSKRYETADYTMYAPGGSEYAACWQCHSESALMTQTNAFSDNHEVHVNWAKAPCILCHDVHRGFDVGEPGLIDFDYPVRRGGYDIQFIDGRNGSTAFWMNGTVTQGNCYIRCHSMEHASFGYVRRPAGTASCTPCHTAPPLSSATRREKTGRAQPG